MMGAIIVGLARALMSVFIIMSVIWLIYHWND